MKTLFSLLILLAITSCESHEYKYRIGGRVIMPDSTPVKLHNAVWFTDTINFNADTLYYFNSNGSRVDIYPPFTIDTLR